MTALQPRRRCCMVDGLNLCACGQGKAKEKYMLTDGDLKKLGSLSKSNPQKKEWTAHETVPP